MHNHRSEAWGFISLVSDTDEMPMGRSVDLRFTSCRADDMSEVEGLDNKLRLPFGSGLVVQFEVCLGERCRVEARFAADTFRDRDDGCVYPRSRQLVVKYLHVRAQRGLADGQGCVFLAGVQREAAACEQQAPAASTQFGQDGVGRDPGAQDPDGRTVAQSWSSPPMAESLRTAPT